MRVLTKFEWGFWPNLDEGLDQIWMRVLTKFGWRFWPNLDEGFDQIWMRVLIKSGWGFCSTLMHVVKRGWKSVRVDRSCKTSAGNSYQLSLRFWACLTLMRAFDSRWEWMRVGGHTRVRIWISSTRWNFLMSSKLMRALESCWECMNLGGQTRVRVRTLINIHQLSCL